MSLAIDIDKVTAVLLDDGWHAVADNSFFIDAYEYVSGDRLDFGGGGDTGVPSAGFSFREQGQDKSWISGPITSLRAVRTGGT